MADLKISALPASTTPLAGTEVLPIVQSGATKQVSIANLTAGRAVNATSMQFGSGTVLSSYEEGTFDPHLSFATGGDTFTYNARIATYTRVGRLVTLNLLIDTSAKGAGTGNLSLINLPFTAAGYTSVVPRTVGITNTGPISAYTYSGQSSLSFFTVSSLGIETQITNTAVGAAITIVMSLTYITS